MLTFALLSWRWVYTWLARQPFLRENVFVLGNGHRAERLVEGLRLRPELGFEIIGSCIGAPANGTREMVSEILRNAAARCRLDRVIVAISDRRGFSPMKELLELRIHGVKIEEATSLLEKITGRIEIED